MTYQGSRRHEIAALIAELMAAREAERLAA